MNITEPLLCRNKPELRLYLSKLCNFCVYTGFILLFVCIVPLVLNAEDAETETPTSITNGEASATGNSAQETAGAESAGEASSDNGSSAPETTTEKITGTSKRMERYEKEGITILIDEAKTVRYNEQDVEVGFLNADKITLKTDAETGSTTEIIAEGNVEIRDQDIFATCDHAIMNNLTNVIVLKENVVVLQDKDRLETKFFTFNRTTGKQTGEGGVKFKVTVTQAAPVDTEAGEDTESGANTGDQETPTTAPEETESEVQKDASTETPNTEADAEDIPDAGAEDSEDTDLKEETDTNAGDPDDTDADSTLR